MNTPRPATLSFQRELPLHEEYEVIVAGGGPAGCTAAAAAAREGARTLLIEATGSLGGMGTNALVPAWCPFSDKEKLVYRGLAEKVLTATKAGMPHVSPQALDTVPIDPERLKRVYDDLVTGTGAKLLFHTQLAAVEREGDRIAAIVVSNKSGLSAYRAKVFVDATGDADLAAWAGAECHQGDDSGQGLMPASHCFLLTNVDDYAYRFTPNAFCGDPRSPIFAILKSGKYPAIPDFHAFNVMVGPGAIGFNAGHLFAVDGTSPESVSAAMIQGRKIAAAFRDALAEFSPAAYGNAFLAATGALMGIRETRRVVGDYVLTLEDYRRRRSFPDEICRNCYIIDVHNKDTKSAQSHADFQKMEAPTERYRPGESHGIPYRCLTPRGLTNLLVAGRSISCDQAVQGSVRVMPTCLCTGEAAGMAAAHAAAAAGDVHAVDVARLRGRLREEGAWLP